MSGGSPLELSVDFAAGAFDFSSPLLSSSHRTGATIIPAERKLYARLFSAPATKDEKGEAFDS